MAVILVPSAAGGNYSVRIAGDTPTPQEQANIDAYVAQMDARRTASQPAQQEPEPEGGLGTALGVGVDMLQQGYGSAIEGLGTATGLEGLRQYGADVASFNKEEIQKATPTLTGYEDVDSLGSAMSFYGQTLAQQVPQLGVSLAGGYGGAKLGTAIGAPFGPPGAALGAVIGGIGGAGLANLPFFYGQNRERQKEVIESTGSDAQVSEGAAILTAIPQAALDGIVDRLLIGKVINPSWITKGGIFTRAVKGGGAGAAVEVPTEIGQAVLERYQAGLPIDDAEAFSEYEQVAIAAGIVGGTVRGGTAVVEGDSRKKKQEEADRLAALELQNDLGEDTSEILQRIKFGEEADAALGERLALPAPPKAPPLTLTQEMRVRDEEAAAGRLPPLPLTQGMRDRGAEVAGGRQQPLTLDQSMRARAAETEAGRAPALPLTQEMRARDAEAAEGRLPTLSLDETMRGPDDTPPTGGGTKPTAPTPTVPSFTPTFVTQTLGLPQRSGLATAAAKDPALAGKPVTDPAVQARLRSLAKAPSVKPEIKAKIEQVLGVSPAAPQQAAQAAPAAPSTPTKAQVDRALQVLQKAREQQVAGKNQLVSKSGAKSLVDAGLLAPEDTAIPAVATAKVTDLLSLGPDAVRQRMTAAPAAPAPQARKSQQTATQPISAPQPSASAAVASESPFGPEYTSKLNRVSAALRKRLTNLGLSDVNLVTSRTIKPDGVQEGVLIEGMMDVDQNAGKRVISLALSVFDPKLSPQELFNAVARVMDHEVIHALRSLGLFKTAEWNSLSELAARQKYMRVKDGRVTERGYTYLQRAQQMYANDTPEVQVEEAVAEMFRDYVAGRLKIGGRPRSLMDRIKGFFRAIWGSHKETGFTDPAAVFASIRAGELGRRERVAAPTPEDTTRMSRAAAQAAPSDPDFRSWATGPKGEQAIVDASGVPVVYYTGTSKDQDFTKFKVGRHGGWFTTNPEEASSYAMQNDSMGYKYEGWSVTQTNQASRVIPAFLRAANPYRGPLPDFVLTQNYKKAQSDWFDRLRAQGYDAWMPSDTPSLMVVLGDDKQVKSVFARGADGKGDMRRFSALTPQDERKNVTNLALARAARGEPEPATPSRAEQMMNRFDDMLAGKDRAYAAARSSGAFDNFQIGDKFIKANNQYAKPMTIIDHVMRPVAGWKNVPEQYVYDGHFPQVVVQTSIGEQTVPTYTLDDPELYTKIGGKPRLVGGSATVRYSAVGPYQTAGERDGRETIGSSVTGADQTRGGASAETPQPVSEVLAPRSAGGSPVVGGLTVDDLDNLNEEFFTKPGWAILTATAEGNSEAKNERMHNRLREELARDGIPYRMVEGMYEGTSDGISYIILADEPTAVYIGQRYDQDSVLTSRGFVYSMGVMPRTAVTGDIVYGEEALAKQFYSKTEEGDAFSLGMDWDTGPTTADIGPGYYTVPERPQLPIRAVDGKVELHHWSNKNLKNVDPKKAGSGPVIGEERRRGAELGFFGIMPRQHQLMQGTGYVKENGLGSKEFIALVDPKSLYPYFTDPDNLSAGLIEEYGKFTHSEFQNEYEERIKNAGYLGYYTERINDTTPLGRVKPTAASYGNVAALFKKIPVKPAQEVQLGLRNQPRYSMLRGMTRPLSNQERRLTVLDRMDPETGRFFSDGVKRDVITTITDLNAPRRNVVIMPTDDNAVTKVARLMLAELRMALIRNPEAIGWYGDTLAKAKRVAAILHPEISPVNPYSGAISNSYDPSAEHAWDLAMAITSNGMAVSENAKFANEQYENWKRTGNFLERGVGTQGTGMVAAFRTYNEMKRRMTDAQISEFLSQQMTVGDLRRHPVIVDLGLDVGGSEAASTVINGSYIFGPKIGQGFYQNLRGNFDPLTMDLWFMRMFNRLTGRPFAEPSEETLRANAERVTAAANSGDLSDYNRGLMERAMAAEGIDMVTVGNADRFAIAFNTLYQRDFKKFYDNAIKESGLDPKSEEAKEIGKAARPPSTEIVLAAKTYSNNLTPSPQDAPRGASDRTFMRAVLAQAKAALANEGRNISTADIQAVMWYAEKQLYEAMGVRGGKGADNDYIDGAIELLQSKGVDNDEIARALPAAERDRLRYRTASERAAGRLRGELDADGAVEDGGGAGGVQEETFGGRQAAPEGDGRRRRVDRRLSRLSVRPSISPTVGRQITARQNELMYARGSDAIAKVLTKTRIAKPDDAKRFTDGLLRRFQDSMLPVGRMIQELSARGLNITDAMDTYLKEWNYHGITGEKIRDNTDRLYNPAIRAVEKLNVPKAKIDQLIALTNAASADGRGYVGLAMQNTDSPKLVLANAYLYAKHARERNRYIQKNIDKTNFTGSGMNDAEAETIVKWFQTLDQQNQSAIGELGAAVRKIIADTTKQRIEGGLVTPDVSDPYQFYVPLRGKEDGDTDTEDPGQMTSTSGRGFGARKREDPRALGRYDYASDVLANVLYQNQTSITRAEKNKVSQSFLKLLRSNPAMTKDYAEILPKAPTIRRQGAQPGVVVETRMDDINSKPEFLVVKENGVEKFVRIRDPRLLGVLNGSNGMSPGMLSPIINAMGTFNRYLASINTSYNPEFMVTNMFRDLQTAGVNLNQYEMNGLTSQVLGNLPSALKGIKRAIINKDESSQWSQVFRDFARAGGQNATNSMNTLADQMSNIESLLTDISESGIRGQYAKVKKSFVGKGVGSLLSMIEDYNTVVENGVRVATYKALIDRGMTKERAAQAARGITVNFAKSGDYRNFMNAFYLFYNASLQGSFALLNAAARSKKVQKLWLATVGAGLLMDQLNSAMSPEDEDEEKVFDKIPEYVLEHNLVLMDPFGITPRGYFAIPLPYGLNAAFNTGRSISRWGRGEYTPGETTSSMWGTLLDVINPIGGSESFANFASPTVLDPFVDVMQNEDFANKAIYKENVSFDKTPAPSSQLHWSTTSPSMVWLTQTLNELTGGNAVRPGYIDISPDIVQFWVEFTLGGAGRFAQSLVETPLNLGKEGITEEVWRGIPFARRLYGSVSEREDTGAYIESAREILMAGEELKRARESGDIQWAQETIKTYGKELRLLGPIKSIESQLTKISRMMNQIERNVQMPEEQKRLMIEKLSERRQELIKRGNALMRQAE